MHTQARRFAPGFFHATLKPMWDLRVICDACANGIRREEDRRAREQAPYGVDALDELQLHAALRAGLAAEGFNVLAEQRYPHHRSKSRRSEGDRCDIVLAPPGAEHLLDPLDVDTLFGHRGADPADALWLEVKIARQFALTDGVAGLGTQYSSQLLTSAIADVRKLANDPSIEFAALALLLFAGAIDIATHDLSAWVNRCLDKSLPVASPWTSTVSITDRIGNTCCLVACIPVGHVSTSD